MNFQVLQGLDAASATVDDMDEWLRIFNLKLRHMREDIASVCLGVPSIDACLLELLVRSIAMKSLKPEKLLSLNPKRMDQGLSIRCRNLRSILIRENMWKIDMKIFLCVSRDQTHYLPFKTQGPHS